MIDLKKQELFKNINNLTFDVLKQIKDAEERLIEKVLTDLLNFKPSGRHFNKVKKVYNVKNTNDYKLWYSGELLGTVVFKMKGKELDILFNPYIDDK